MVEVTLLLVLPLFWLRLVLTIFRRVFLIISIDMEFLILMKSYILFLYDIKTVLYFTLYYYIILHSHFKHKMSMIKLFFELVSELCSSVFLDRFVFLDWDRVSLRSKYLVIAVVCRAAHDYVAYFIKGAVSLITLQIKILNMRNAHSRHDDNARIIIAYQL